MPLPTSGSEQQVSAQNMWNIFSSVGKVSLIVFHKAAAENVEKSDNTILSVIQ